MTTDQGPDAAGTFGSRLRERRLARGLSQGALAGGELSMSYVSLLESGKREPTRRVAEVLAERLGIDADLLLTGVSSSHRRERELELRFADLALASGDPLTALERLDQLRDRAAPDAQDASFAWRCDWSRARALEDLGQLEAAVDLLERLRRRALAAPGTGRPEDVAVALSRCYRQLGDLDHAVDVARAAVEQAVRLPAHHRSRLVATLAAAHRERGDLARAGHLLRQLIADLEDDGEPIDRARAHWNAAVVAADRGEHAEALALAERALAVFGEQADDRTLASLHTLLGWLLLEQDDADPEASLAALARAESLQAEAAGALDRAYVLTERSRALLAAGRAVEAFDAARSALAEVGPDARLETARAAVAMAWALFAQGESAAWEVEAQRAAEALATTGARREAAVVWRELADLHAATGDAQLAARCSAQALDCLGVPARRRPLPVSDATAVPGTAALTSPASP